MSGHSSLGQRTWSILKWREMLFRDQSNSPLRAGFHPAFGIFLFALRHIDFVTAIGVVTVVVENEDVGGIFGAATVTGAGNTAAPKENALTPRKKWSANIAMSQRCMVGAV